MASSTPIDPFDETWIAVPIATRFERVAERYRDKVASEDGRQRFTYGEMRQAVARLAGAIRRTVAAGAPVGIALPGDARFPIAALACLAAGRPYVPIDLSYPPSHNARVFGEAGLAAAIADRGDPDGSSLPALLPVLDVLAPSLAAEDEPIEIAPSNGPAVILFTSGSTGQPKGICNDQRAILQRVVQATRVCTFTAADSFLLLSSPGTIAGEREMFSALLNGATLAFANPLRVGIAGVLELAERTGATFAYSVPAVMRTILTAPNAKRAFAQFRILRVGGDHVLDSDLALYREVMPETCKILVSFSSTEVPAVFQWFVPRDWQPDGLRLPIGYACSDVSFSLRGEDSAGEGTGHTGELIVRSKYLALGLWQKGRLEPGPFVADPDAPDSRVYDSGDIVHLRPDGLAEMVGRKDRQIKLRGLRVGLAEIEAVFRRCPGIADVAVIPRRNGIEVEALIAYVTPRANAAPDLVEVLRRTIANALPPHMRPAHIRIIDEIPRLPSYKPDIKALEQHEKLQQALAVRSPCSTEDQAETATAAEPPSAAPRLAKIVEHAWTALLDRASFAADRSWEEAGGDSLKALELWFRIESALGRALPLDALQPATTPSRLVATIDRLLQGPDESEEADDRPTVFLFPGILGDEPLLVGFRAQFAGLVRFALIDYPDWRQSSDGAIGFARLADAAVAQILAKAGAGPCFLAGYSYGGFVAHEAARRLLAAGHRVGLLALIDTRRATLSFAERVRHVRNVLSSPEQLPLALERRIVAFCFRRRWFAPLHFLLSDGMTARVPRLAFAFRYHLLWMLRLEAMKAWQPSPIAVPTIVFSSGDAFPGQTPDLGWDGLCEPLRIAPIGGTHASILQPPQLERLCARLLSALRVGGDIAPRAEAANDAQAAPPLGMPDLVNAAELGAVFASRSA